jgi:hypothetical protein
MNEKQYDWSFGFQYFIACAVGVAILGMVAFLTMWSIGEFMMGFAGETAAWITAGSLFGSLIALGASVGTGLLLAGQGVEARKWIGFSAAAGGIGGALGFGLVATFSNVETVPESLAGVMMGLTVGLPLGIGQLLALRQAGVATNVWPMITTIAFIFAFSVGFALGGEGREWIALGGMGLICGSITALAMVWLLGSKQTAVAA